MAINDEEKRDTRGRVVKQGVSEDLNNNVFSIII